MVDSEGNRVCEAAEAYYHDFLLDPDDPSIPETVAEHLGHCVHCRYRISRLGDLLVEAQSEGQSCRSDADADLIAELQRQFEHLGRAIGCAQVKAFLPALARVSVRIRIPTPVTAHVDHCDACAADLETLCGLGLDDGQLTRLARMYAKLLADGSESGDKVATQAGPLGWVSLPGLGSEVCGRELSAADVFDFVVPGGRADGGQDELAGHLRSCPRCLKKVQSLHRVVCGVLNRADSEVVTVYTAGASCRYGPDGPYAGHAVDVQVFGVEPDPAAAEVESMTGVGALLRRAAAHPVLSSFAKTAVLAAAMIPLAVVFWASTRSASGLNSGQILDMVVRARAVHVQTFHANVSADEPTVDVWLAGQKVIWKDPREHTIYDLAGRRKVDVGVGRPGVGWVALDGGDFANVRETVDRLLSFAPPRQAELTHVPGDAGAVPADGIEFYEFVQEQSDPAGDPVVSRWTVSFDAAGRRPLAIEFSQEARGEEFVTVTRFSYPEPSDVERRIETLLQTR